VCRTAISFDDPPTLALTKVARSLGLGLPERNILFGRTRFASGSWIADSDAVRQFGRSHGSHAVRDL